MIHPWLRGLSPFCILLAVTACEEQPISHPSGCGANTAMISIQDTLQVIQCGCDEASGTVVHSGQTLTCTIPAGTWVVFDLSVTKLKHQLISTGTPSFSSSAVRDPSWEQSILSHSAKFDTVGTYSFHDQFQSGISGNIVAR